DYIYAVPRRRKGRRATAQSAADDDQVGACFRLAPPGARAPGHGSGEGHALQEVAAGAHRETSLPVRTDFSSASQISRDATASWAETTGDGFPWRTQSIKWRSS